MEVLAIIAVLWILCALIAAGFLEQAPRKPYQPPRKGK